VYCSFEAVMESSRDWTIFERTSTSRTTNK